jgi:preprotein translocase SecF subunit
MFNFIQRRNWFYLISAFIIVPGVIAMIYSVATIGTPVRMSIDFKGGSLYLVKFDKPVTETAIRQVYAQFGQPDPVIQQFGSAADNRWQIRAGDLTVDQQAKLKAALNTQVATIDTQGSTFDVVDPEVGSEVTTAAVIAVIAAGIVILGFIWFAFRRIPHSVRYGACAIIAMLHDVFVTVGVMSLLGIFLKWEADSLFLTAVLTVVGYSVQDTIVVFDRIRENIPKYRGEDYETVVNRSLMETLHRSLSTSICAFFVMIAILLFGGPTIQQFIAVMLIGLISGTYSSIFNAVPLLVSWEKGELPFTRRATA